MGKRILVVERDEAVISALERALRSSGLEPVIAHDRGAAIDLYARHRPSAIVLAVDLGTESGREVCDAIRSRRDGAVVPILFLGTGGPAEAVRSPSEALSIGGDYFFRRPIDYHYLADRIRAWTGTEEPAAGALEGIEWHEAVTATADTTAPGHLSTEGDDAAALVIHGEELAAHGERASAVDAFEAAAGLFALTGRHDDALQMYRRMLEIDPARSDVVNRAAAMAVEAGLNAEAIALYRLGVDQLERQGDLFDASELCRKILSLDPQHAWAREALSRLEFKLLNATGELRVYPKDEEEDTGPDRPAIADDEEPTPLPRLEVTRLRIENERTTPQDRAPIEEARARMAARAEIVPDPTPVEPPWSPPTFEPAPEFDELALSETTPVSIAEDELAPIAPTPPELTPVEPTPVEPRAEPVVVIESVVESVAEEVIEDPAEERAEEVPDIDTLPPIRDEESFAMTRSEPNPLGPNVSASLPPAVPAPSERAEAHPQIAESTMAAERTPSFVITPQDLRTPSSEFEVQRTLIQLENTPLLQEGTPVPYAAINPNDLLLPSAELAAPTPVPSVPVISLRDLEAIERAELRRRQSRSEPASSLRDWDAAQAETLPPPPPPPPPPIERGPSLDLDSAAREAAELDTAPRSHAAPLEDTTAELEIPPELPNRAAPRTRATPAHELESQLDSASRAAPRTRATTPNELEPQLDFANRAAPHTRATAENEPESQLDFANRAASRTRATPENELESPLDSANLATPRTRATPAGELEPQPDYPSAALVPPRGTLSALADALLLLLHLHTQRATGVLRLQGTRDAPALVIAAGLPAATRDPRAAQLLLTIFTKLGRLPPPALPELLERALTEKPRDLCRALIERSLLREAECAAVLERELEAALLVLLRHRGSWSFDQVGLNRDELYLAGYDLRARLIDLLPRAAPVAELALLLGGSRATVRVYEGIEKVATPLDARFLALLDGRYTLEEAIELSGAPYDRALAAAAVYTLFGLATRIDARPRALLDRALPPLQPPELLEPLEQPPAEEHPEIARPVTLGVALDPPPQPSLPPVRVVRATTFPRPWISSIDREDRERELRAYADVVRSSDYFTILGVEPTAPYEAIAAAHRTLRRNLRLEDFQRNPELYGLAREVLRSIDEAWDVLSVPELRAAYQQHLKPHTRH